MAFRLIYLAVAGGITACSEITIHSLRKQVIVLSGLTCLGCCCVAFIVGAVIF